jgi:hypothetical protein
LRIQNVSSSIEDAIFAGDYDRVLAALEKFSPPADQPYLSYWYQGLCHLLQGDEETAQGSWFSTLLELPTPRKLPIKSFVICSIKSLIIALYRINPRKLG